MKTKQILTAAILLSALFSFPANGQNLKPKSQEDSVKINKTVGNEKDEIIFDKGWQKIVFGVGEEEIKAFLGKTDLEFYSYFSTTRSFAYPEKGLIVTVHHETKKVVKIIFIGDASLYPTNYDLKGMSPSADKPIIFKNFTGKPGKVSWGQSIEKAIAAYGEPEAKFEIRGDTVLLYGNTSLFFGKGKLYKVLMSVEQIQ